MELFVGDLIDSRYLRILVLMVPDNRGVQKGDRNPRFACVGDRRSSVSCGDLRVCLLACKRLALQSTMVFEVLLQLCATLGNRGSRHLRKQCCFLCARVFREKTL